MRTETGSKVQESKVQSQAVAAQRAPGRTLDFGLWTLDFGPSNCVLFVKRFYARFASIHRVGVTTASSAMSCGSTGTSGTT